MCILKTQRGIRTKRQDLETHFDEADYIIPHQVNSAIEHGQKVVKVISADTDVFVLLCSHYKYNNWSGAEVYLEARGGTPFQMCSHVRTMHSDFYPRRGEAFLALFKAL